MLLDANAIGLFVGIATLGGIVWKMASSVAEFSAAVVTMKKELDIMKSSLDRFPLLEHRVSQLEAEERRRGDAE